eukprot:1545107-Pleurochrysis_carterae.AAC.1
MPLRAAKLITWSPVASCAAPCSSLHSRTFLPHVAISHALRSLCCVELARFRAPRSCCGCSWPFDFCSSPPVPHARADTTTYLLLLLVMRESCGDFVLPQPWPVVCDRCAFGAPFTNNALLYTAD